MKVLFLQPYNGGSHAAFLAGWIGDSRHAWEAWSLPARFWKWRMRQAAVEFAQRVDQAWRSGQRWDCLCTTDMMNVAEFRGLVTSPARDLPIVLYFHENQWAYPNRHEDPRDLHFGFTNFTSALAADRVWFNSAFNRDSLLEGLRLAAREWPDHVPTDAIDEVARRAEIWPPGIAIPAERIQSLAPPTDEVHLVWAARWEHDKNPAGLLAILDALDASGIPFRISVLGAQFRDRPASFETLRRRYAERIIAWGYQTDREAYWRALGAGDVFLSTATHEFYGLAALEGMAAGLVPVLPNRLAYPELVAPWPAVAAHLYSTQQEAVAAIGSIARRLAHWRDRGRRSAVREQVRQTADWSVVAPRLDDELERVGRPRGSTARLNGPEARSGRFEPPPA